MTNSRMQTGHLVNVFMCVFGFTVAQAPHRRHSFETLVFITNHFLTDVSPAA